MIKKPRENILQETLGKEILKPFLKAEEQSESY